MRRLNLWAGIIILFIGLLWHDLSALFFGCAFLLFAVFVCPWLVRLISK
jgi:hypothetical protein